MNTKTEMIRMWARERDLHNANPDKQLHKLAEEYGELCGAYNKGLGLDEVKKEIGDIYVVIAILSMQLGVNVEDCIDLAYEKIKNRQGETVNGVYVKNEDLKGLTCN